MGSLFTTGINGTNPAGTEITGITNGAVFLDLVSFGFQVLQILCISSDFLQTSDPILVALLVNFFVFQGFRQISDFFTFSGYHSGVDSEKNRTTIIFRGKTFF